jgi:hypothetical protein
VLVAVVVLGALAAAGVAAWRHPLALPGRHTVAVYAVDEDVTQELAGGAGPGWLGRLVGLCDADSFYVRDGDRRLCLVLSGPLGAVRARADGDRVVVPADQAASLAALAARDTGAPQPARTLALYAGGRPVALVGVAGLAAGRAVSVPALR